MAISDISRLGNIETPTQIKPSQTRDSNPGIGFQDALDKLQTLNPQPQAPVSPSATEGLKFSNHAVERMRSRGISFQPEDLQQIRSAVDRAAAKGSKDTLVLTKDSALIVSVKNNTVVTVMDKAALKENVFTNIDSTVVI
jgi:flagellar operon protein